MYTYILISGSEFSLKHCPNDAQKAMLGKILLNDMAESSFAGATTQV